MRQATSSEGGLLNSKGTNPISGDALFKYDPPSFLNYAKWIGLLRGWFTSALSMLSNFNCFQLFSYFLSLEPLIHLSRGAFFHEIISSSSSSYIRIQYNSIYNVFPCKLRFTK